VRKFCSVLPCLEKEEDMPAEKLVVVIGIASLEWVIPNSG